MKVLKMGELGKASRTTVAVPILGDSLASRAGPYITPAINIISTPLRALARRIFCLSDLHGAAMPSAAAGADSFIRTLHYIQTSLVGLEADDASSDRNKNDKKVVMTGTKVKGVETLVYAQKNDYLGLFYMKGMPRIDYYGRFEYNIPVENITHSGSEALLVSVLLGSGGLVGDDEIQDDNATASQLAKVIDDYNAAAKSSDSARKGVPFASSASAVMLSWFSSCTPDYPQKMKFNKHSNTDDYRTAAPRSPTAEQIRCLRCETLRLRNSRMSFPFHSHLVIFKRQDPQESEKGLIAINGKDPWNRTALYHAAAANKPQCVRVLLERGADPNIGQKEGATPLFIAAQNGFHHVVEALVDCNRTDVNQATTKTDSTPLYVSAQNGRYDAVMCLVKKGKADIDKPQADGSTPVYVAVQNKHNNILKFLLKNGADPMRGNVSNSVFVPLFMAVQADTPMATKMLLSKGANPNIRVDVTAQQKMMVGGDVATFPLLLCAVANKPEMTRLLLKYGARVDMVGINGTTALHMACAYASSKSAAVLIKHGADIEHPDNRGFTPLMRSIYKSEAELGYLAHKFTKTDDMEKYIEAVNKRRRNLAEFLLFQGADPNQQTPDGFTPLMTAVAANDPEMIDLLVEHGADVNMKTATGVSASIIAVTLGQSRIQCLMKLKSHGADPKKDREYLERVSKEVSERQPEIIIHELGDIPPQYMPSDLTIKERLDYSKGFHERQQLKESLNDPSKKEQVVKELVRRGPKDGLKFVRRLDKFKKEEAAIKWFQQLNRTEWKKNISKLSPAEQELNELMLETSEMHLRDTLESRNKRREEYFKGKKERDGDSKPTNKDYTALDSLSLDIDSEDAKREAIDLAQFTARTVEDTRKEMERYTYAKARGLPVDTQTEQLVREARRQLQEEGYELPNTMPPGNAVVNSLTENHRDEDETTRRFREAKDDGERDEMLRRKIEEIDDEMDGFKSGEISRDDECESFGSHTESDGVEDF
eukprot:jgi/Bigna1/89017/estExt_fgenesh1_pg.C_420092